MWRVWPLVVLLPLLGVREYFTPRTPPAKAAAIARSWTGILRKPSSSLRQGMRDGVRELAFETPSALAVVDTVPAELCRTLSHFTMMPLASTSPASQASTPRENPRPACLAGGLRRLSALATSLRPHSCHQRAGHDRADSRSCAFDPFQKEVIVVDEYSGDVVIVFER